MTPDIVFSICVPIGSYHPFLRNCLESLLAQKIPVEIAVIDASNDKRVLDLVDEYSDRIAYRFHGPDGGQTDAIMKGWAATKGSVLGWLNADDALTPGALESARQAFLDNPTKDLVFGHSLICDDDAFISGYHWNVLPPGEQILSTCSISQPSCFFKRRALEAIGGLNRELHYTMDWDLWIRLFKNGAKFHFQEKVWSLVLWSKEAKTGGLGAARRKELRRLLQAHASAAERRNAYLGFATQYIYEYLLPRSIRNWIWRRNTSGGRTMFGLDVSGDIEEYAVFELFHYDPAPRTLIEIRTSSPQYALQVVVGGEEAQAELSRSDLLTFRLPKPVSPDQSVRVEVKRASKTPLHLRGIRLV